MEEKVTSDNPIIAYNARLTPEERKAAASKAGKASAEARKEKKSLREKWEIAMSLVPPTKIRKKFKEAMKMPVEDWDDIMIATCIKEALSGNLKAIEIAYKMRGLLVDKKEVTGKDGESLNPQIQVSIIDNRSQIPVSEDSEDQIASPSASSNDWEL